MTIPHYLYWHDAQNTGKEQLDAIMLEFVIRNLGRIMTDKTGKRFVLWALRPDIDTKTREVVSYIIDAMPYHPDTCTKYLQGAQ